MAQEEKSEYRNDSPGVVGVIVIQNEKERGIAVQPGDTIWLSEREKIATANAPKRDEDNPLVNGNLTLVTPSTEKANRRPLGPDTVAPEAPPEAAAPAEEPPAPDTGLTPEEEAEKAKAAKEAEAARVKAARAKAQAENPGAPVDETGARVAPQGLPHQGQRQAGEEVGTPDAPAAPAKAATPAKG